MFKSFINSDTQNTICLYNRWALDYEQVRTLVARGWAAQRPWFSSSIRNLKNLTEIFQGFCPSAPLFPVILCRVPTSALCLLLHGSSLETASMGIELVSTVHLSRNRFQVFVRSTCGGHLYIFGSGFTTINYMKCILPLDFWCQWAGLFGSNLVIFVVVHIRDFYLF